ncbi:hypothetical protein CEXT_620851 [Caerostris extrusa]|uniref:Uncharacterized protein n=1 Tax=Caerostris extrusa TaxID=172846 RepID=A0AAV4VSA9_CAEEX|nr:hypothetical protein CEXT_620851 [Caerostris extrusa]
MYLADSSANENVLNLTLKGQDDILAMSEIVTAFQKKIRTTNDFWGKYRFNAQRLKTHDTPLHKTAVIMEKHGLTEPASNLLINCSTTKRKQNFPLHYSTTVPGIDLKNRIEFQLGHTHSPSRILKYDPREVSIRGIDPVYKDQKNRKLAALISFPQLRKA